MSDQEEEVYSVKSGRLRERKATKVLPPRAAKLSFKYESEDLENAVSAVLCGMSIKEAAISYNISKALLKQALSDEMDNEPQDDGGMVEENGNESGDSAVRDSISKRLAECQAVYESQKLENNKRKVEEALKDGVLVFGDEVNVTCGFISGVLHRKKFFCPGLHSECILTDGQWVTPKQFSIMGGKASLKNWKNAIRINNVNLRNFMEQGRLDFWDHQINCSGKCYHKTSGGPGKYQSKINCLEKKTQGNIEILTQTLGGPSLSPNNSLLLEDNLNDDIPSFVPMVQSVSSSPAFSSLRKAQGKEDSEDNQPVFPAPVIKTEQPDSGDYEPPAKPSPIVLDTQVLNISPVTSEIPQQRSLLLRNQALQAHKQKDIDSSQPQVITPIQASADNTVTVTPGNTAVNQSTVRYLIQNGVIKGQVKQIGQHQFILQNNLTDHPPEILQVASSFPDIESIMKDSKKFWQGISEIGLMSDIFSEIKAKIRSTKHEMFTNITEENAERMSLLISSLGLQTKVKYKLANHKVAAEAQNRKIQEEINELQKKMEDSQKRQAELKRKSHCFEKLLQKRPRLEKDSSLSEDSQDKPNDQVSLRTGTKRGNESEANENESETSDIEIVESETLNKSRRKNSETVVKRSGTDRQKRGGSGSVNVIDTESGVGVKVKVGKDIQQSDDDSDDEDNNSDSDSERSS